MAPCRCNSRAGLLYGGHRPSNPNPNPTTLNLTLYPYSPKPTLIIQVVFIFQLAPTPDDTYGAFVFSHDFNLSPSLLAFSSALDLTIGMIGAALLFQRIALPPLAAFTMGAVSRALASAALLPLTLTAAPSTALYLAQVSE